MKKVSAEELRVGMFVERTEGSWMAHGLWRTRFMISNAEVLESARRSGAKEFWIDLERGSNEVAPDTDAPPPDIVVVAKASSPSAPVQAVHRPTSFAEETVRASRICRSARAAVVSLFDDVRSGRPPMIEASVKDVVSDVVDSVTRNSNALVNLARLKTKDDYTFMHSVSVCALMVSLARKMGHDDGMCRTLGLGGLLHDIGKALVPLDLLNKPGKLSDEEFAIVKRHSFAGHGLLVGADLKDEVVLDLVLHHHEKIDGSGYPDQLVEAELSLAARMGAICDVYDAVTSARPYKEAWDPSVALKRMASWRGHFDRDVLATFIQMMGIYPAGSLVRLKSNRIAIVVESHPDSLHRPVVKVFYSAKSRMNIPLEILDLAQTGVNDVIVDREPRDDWSASFLDSVSRAAPASTN